MIIVLSATTLPPSATEYNGKRQTRGGGKGATYKTQDMLDVFSSAMRRQIGEQVLEVLELKRVVAKK